MKTFALLCVGLAGLAPVLRAQQPSPARRPVLPPGPLLNKAPDFAQWTVTSRPAPEPSPAGASPAATPKTPRHHPTPPDPPTSQTTTVVKTEGTRYEETVTGTGVKTRKWCVPDMQITVEGEGPPVVALKDGGQNSGAFTDYSKGDFTGFEWISPRNFTGIEKVAEQDCLVFRDAPRERAAYVNAATRLPVRLEADDEVSTYEFGLAPQAMLTLPPDIAAVVARWQETLRQSSLKPAKP